MLAKNISITKKAVKTTASVEYGWAGAVMQVKSPFGVFSHSVTDVLIDKPTNQLTE